MVSVNKILNKILGKTEDYNEEVAEICPGSKIRSKGRGRGLGIGKGRGPIGRM